MAKRTTKRATKRTTKRKIGQTPERKNGEKLFWGKVFGTKYDVVVAICDEELIDKRLEYKGGGGGADAKVGIKVSKSFYGEKIIDAQTALRLMQHATIGNLMGKRITGLAEENDFITKENIISIGGVPHAQFVKIQFV